MIENKNSRESAAFSKQHDGTSTQTRAWEKELMLLYFMVLVCSL